MRIRFYFGAKRQNFAKSDVGAAIGRPLMQRKRQSRTRNARPYMDLRSYFENGVLETGGNICGDKRQRNRAKDSRREHAYFI